MELSFTRCELAQVATVSHKGTLCIFPSGAKKKRQKFVVGDDAGAVSCFEMKRGEAQESFVFLTSSGEAVSSLALNSNEKRRDRVFASQGQSIFAVSKKGEEKFRLVSPSTESIHFMAVDDLALYTGAEFIFQLYADAKDAGFLLCDDCLTAMALLPSLDLGGTADCVLACSDRRLRVVRPRSSGPPGVHLEHLVASTATALHAYGTQEAMGRASRGMLAYGTQDGRVGMVAVNEASVEQIFEVDRVEGSSGGVALVTSHDLTGDGVEELVVAWDDGTVAVLRVPGEAHGGEAHGELAAFAPVGSLGEAVKGLACGQVSSPGFEEIVALTYSGRVVSFTTEPLGTRDAEDAMGRTVLQTRAEASLKYACTPPPPKPRAFSAR